MSNSPLNNSFSQEEINCIETVKASPESEKQSVFEKACYIIGNKTRIRALAITLGLSTNLANANSISYTIEEYWNKSSFKEIWLKLGGNNTPEGKDYYNQEIGRIVEEYTTLYLSKVDENKKEMLRKQLNKLSISNMILILNIYHNVYYSNNETTPKDFAIDLFILVQSREKGTGTSLDKLQKLTAKYPELNIQTNRYYKDLSKYAASADTLKAISGL